MTQYVKHFPIPDPNNNTSKKIIQLSKEIYNSKHMFDTQSLENEINDLIWQIFGVSEE
jgi:hypothetical protein